MKLKAASIVAVVLATIALVVSLSFAATAQEHGTLYIPSTTAVGSLSISSSLVLAGPTFHTCPTCGWTAKMYSNTFQFAGVNGATYTIKMKCPRCLDKALQKLGVGEMVEIKQ